MPPKRKKSSGEEQGPTPLFLACQKGDVDAARSLLAEGAEVNRAGEDCATPLYIACSKGHVDAARLLLNNGAEVDRVGKYGETPLWTACSNGYVDAARLCLDHGAEVDRAREDGRTPLYSACWNGHVDSARLLLNEGAEVDRADQQEGRRWSPLVAFGRRDRIVMLLKDHISKAKERSREELDSLRAKVKTLEEANEKLTRRLGRYEGKVLDLTAEDSDDEEAPPRRSKLRERHDKETTELVAKVKKERDDHKSRVAKVTKERDDHESRGELLDSMVTPLESQRRELQEMVSAAAEALMERDVPTRMLADDAAPFYYSQNSWEAEQEIPWNAEADRPMSLAEGIAWVHDNAKPPRKRRR